MPSILDNKNTSAPSVFLPAALLREARRQKGLAAVDVPPVCILDPDGDIVRRLRQTGEARPFEHWPCYHTRLDTFTLAGQTVGIVGCAVGAPFAVLIAEELFACGCRLLVSLTSAGQIVPPVPRPTSSSSTARCAMRGPAITTRRPRSTARRTRRWWRPRRKRSKAANPPVIVGASWTTDAPFRETAEAIEAARSKGVLAVEMEAAALYAFARATGARVLCLAHVTNTMGQAGQDFEKGEADGTADALSVLEAILTR